ncbi:MAG TPA: hypothetical protein PLU53_03400 [Bacteroidia bacterium]|nr:hypothetical protein [Bacteroidia bacterium]
MGENSVSIKVNIIESHQHNPDTEFSIPFFTKEGSGLKRMVALRNRVIQLSPHICTFKYYSEPVQFKHKQ